MAIKVTADGDVTIPRQVLQKLGIGPGSEVDIRRTADGTLVFEEVNGAPSPSSRLGELRGTADAGFSTDEIMAMTRGE